MVKFYRVCEETWNGFFTDPVFSGEKLLLPGPGKIHLEFVGPDLPEVE